MLIARGCKSLPLEMHYTKRFSASMVVSPEGRSEKVRCFVGHDLCTVAFTDAVSPISSLKAEICFVVVG